MREFTYQALIFDFPGWLIPRQCTDCAQAGFSGTKFSYNPPVHAGGVFENARGLIRPSTNSVSTQARYYGALCHNTALVDMHRTIICCMISPSPPRVNVT